MYINDIDTPKYLSVKSHILDAIRNGELKYNEKLMSRSKMEEFYNVSASTINKALEELSYEGYIYKIKGKGTFVTKRKASYANKVIALIIPLNSNPTKTDISPFLTSSIAIGVRDTEYNLMVFDSLDEIKSLDEAVRQEVAGIIMMSYFPTNQDHAINAMKQIIESGTPIVMIDRIIDNMETGFVSTDHFRGAYYAIKSLIDDGFTKIYHFSSKEKNSAIMQRRFGYSQAMLSADLNPEVFFVDTLSDSGYPEYENKFYEALLETKEILDEKCAIFTTNGDGLRGIWKAVVEHNLLYKELALATFDNPDIILPSHVKFVNVIQHLDQIGYDAVHMIIDMINDNAKDLNCIINPRIYKNHEDITEKCNEIYKDSVHLR